MKGYETVIEIDLDEVDARHDEAVLVGRKMNTDPLDDEDILTLFKCCSDVPLLLAYIAGLEAQIRLYEERTDEVDKAS